MKKKIIKLVLIIMFFSGISILLYPFISRYWNSKVQTKAISDYKKMYASMKKEDYDNYFFKLDNYNKKLSKLDFPLVQHKNIISYLGLIDVNNNKMIGYLSIEKIKVELPIYYGTSSSVLNVGVGNLEGSSIPIGGDSTHSVLSAHRGLPSAKLFTNLNKLEVGDIFIITVLDRKLTYQVENISVINPNDVSELEIINGKDYVTLMTCTPYGLNTHRLLVRGIRIENEEVKELVIASDAGKIDKLVVTIVIVIPILFILIVYIMIKPVKKNYLYKEVI